METGQTLVIIHNKKQIFDRQTSNRFYLIDYFRKSWEASGLIIKDVYGTDEFIPADAAFLHIDLSVIPDEYLSFASRYHRVINGQVHDIRKSVISKNLISKDEAYEGQVIVKTDLNAGGGPERSSIFIERTYHYLWRILPAWAKPVGIYSQKDYTIFENPALVPRKFYHDPKLVVEKFLPEKWGKIYCHRRYYFLGEKEVNQLWLSKDPLCFSGDEIVLNKPVIPELRSLRKKLGFDFGAFDYVMRDGNIILFDVNKTPGVGSSLDFLDELWLAKLLNSLSDGIFTL